MNNNLDNLKALLENLLLQKQNTTNALTHHAIDEQIEQIKIRIRKLELEKP